MPGRRIYPAPSMLPPGAQSGADPATPPALHRPADASASTDPLAETDPRKTWAERGGLLVGVSLSALGTYSRLDLPQGALPPGTTSPGQVSGAGYGGTLLVPVLYSGRNSTLPLLRRLGATVSLGVDGGQARLRLDSGPVKADAFVASYEFPLRAGLAVDLVTFSPDGWLTWLGSGVTVVALYRRTYRVSQVRFKTTLETGPEAGRTLIFDQSTRGLTGSAFELELSFASPGARLSDFLKKPSFKVNFFLLPTNPFVAAVGLGLVQYF